MAGVAGFPDGLIVLERGWLSANCLLFTGPSGTALLDSGYCTHAPQTLALVEQALGGRPLELLLNTHLHSDHCGGNAALQERYPGLRTCIPPGQARHVRPWNAEALSYGHAGQQCPPFGYDGLLRPGTELALGRQTWQVHAAPGHDPYAVVLFEPRSRTLASADALWENGFGVVFPELEGERAFGDVAATLDLLESLRPRLVVPGHGRPFQAMGPALALARGRLEGFLRNPRRHALHAAKVLLKFKLLEWQQTSLPGCVAWASATPCLGMVHRRFFPEQPLTNWVAFLLDELVRSGAARRENTQLFNASRLASRA